MTLNLEGNETRDVHRSQDWIVSYTWGHVWLNIRIVSTRNREEEQLQFGFNHTASPRIFGTRKSTFKGFMLKIVAKAVPCVHPIYFILSSWTWQNIASYGSLWSAVARQPVLATSPWLGWKVPLAQTEGHLSRRQNPKMGTAWVTTQETAFFLHYKQEILSCWAMGISELICHCKPGESGADHYMPITESQT